MKVSQVCFKTIKDFNSNANYRKGAGFPGVYMWGFSLEEADYSIPSSPARFFPYYVGKVSKKNGCMYERTQLHLGTIMGGNTSIFDIPCLVKLNSGLGIGAIHAEYLKSSKEAQKNNKISPPLPNPQYPHLLHYPEGVHRMYQFTTDQGIKDQIDWMIRHFCITYFSLQEYDANGIVELEKFIGNLVGYDRLVTKRYIKLDLEVEIIDNKASIILKEYKDLFNHCRGVMVGKRFGI